MIRLIFLSILLISCASDSLQRSQLTSSNNKFVLTDSSGRFVVQREVKLSKNKLITRTKLFSSLQMTKSLETTVAVSNIGSRSSSKRVALLPEASQFQVWLEKKAYKSQIKIDKQKRKINTKTNSPEKSWNGEKSIAIPKGKYFCFFSQLPECFILQNLLLKARKRPISLYVIWDNYPFHSEQFEGLDPNIMSLATLSFSQKQENSLRFEVDLGNQIIFYHFDRQLKFEKLFWITQGISLTRIERSTIKEQQ